MTDQPTDRDPDGVPVPVPVPVAEPVPEPGPGPAAAAPVLDPAVAARLRRNSDGLVPAVAQQWDTGEVLMLGWMDDEALRRTLSTGRATYFSRSRREYWRKGDTSGNTQWVREVRLDFDGDTLLVKVDQVGPACHTGARTCFDEDRLDAVVGTAPARPSP